MQKKKRQINKLRGYKLDEQSKLAGEKLQLRPDNFSGPSTSRESNLSNDDGDGKGNAAKQ